MRTDPAQHVGPDAGAGHAAGSPVDPLTDPAFRPAVTVPGRADDGYDLAFHGDKELLPNLVDLAVNVRYAAPPSWLRKRLAADLDELGMYPNDEPARAAVAGRHKRMIKDVLITAGGAEAFTLLARVLQPRRAVVVHPSFTAPEVALTAAGHPVERLVLPPPFVLDPRAVPADADLVILGNPTNPTSVLHPADLVASLAREGRTLVVDEAFADAVPGEPASLAGRRDLPGLVVVRSLTKSWGLAGLRVGYLLGPPALVRKLRAAQPPWPVSSLAITAVYACCSPNAVAEATAGAALLAWERERATHEMGAAGAEVVPGATAPFVLIKVPDGPGVREALRAEGFAVRRGDTFPGLGPDWLRVTIRERATMEPFAAALARVLGRVPGFVAHDGGVGYANRYGHLRGRTP